MRTTFTGLIIKTNEFHQKKMKFLKFFYIQKISLVFQAVPLTIYILTVTFTSLPDISIR